jgi:AcrR family transcriptional regulator
MPVQPASSLSGRRFEEEHLLDAARAVFHADGFASAQVADIARGAGTTKPTLYARLGNKEQIYMQVLQRDAEVSWVGRRLGARKPFAPRRAGRGRD